jgi:transcriptional regulator with XRE-family HTH domain
LELKKDSARPLLLRDRGRRLKKLRLLAGLEKTDLAPIAGVALSTFEDWEYGKHSGLPVKRAEKMLPAFWDKEIKCTLNWLMYNIGNEPEITTTTLKINSKEIYTPIGKIAEEKQIAQELEYFQKNNAGSVGFVVNDDGMLPHYAPGDIVAGIKLNKKEFKKAIGKHCLVQLNDGIMLLRNLQPTDNNNQFSLLCLNDNSKRKKILYGIEPVIVAPIIWHRRKRLLA